MFETLAAVFVFTCHFNIIRWVNEPSAEILPWILKKQSNHTKFQLSGRTFCNYLLKLCHIVIVLRFAEKSRQFLGKTRLVTTVAPRSLQLSGGNFTLDWFHYFQLPSLLKWAFYIDNRSFADRCNTMTKSGKGSCRLITSNVSWRCGFRRRTKYLHLPSNFTLSIFELFFWKKIPLSRRVEYVMGRWVSQSVRDVCISHQSDWIYYKQPIKFLVVKVNGMWGDLIPIQFRTTIFFLLWKRKKYSYIGFTSTFSMG